MQHFYKKLQFQKDGGTIYQSFLKKVAGVSPAEIKRVGWFPWGV